MKKEIKAVLDMEKKLVDNIFNLCTTDTETVNVSYIKIICDISWSALNNGMNLSILKKDDLKKAQSVLKLNKTMFDSIYFAN